MEPENFSRDHPHGRDTERQKAKSAAARPADSRTAYFKQTTLDPRLFGPTASRKGSEERQAGLLLKTIANISYISYVLGVLLYNVLDAPNPWFAQRLNMSWGNFGFFAVYCSLASFAAYKLYQGAVASAKRMPFAFALYIASFLLSLEIVVVIMKAFKVL